MSVSTTTSDEIAARRVQLLDQALNTSPGLFAFRGKGVQDTNSGVGMRGFAGRGSGQARVLVLVDGQPVNDSYTGQVNWTTLPVEEVDRVEVVRGSFSALYGGNAMGGVVNVLTKPVTRRQAEIYGQLGNQATTRYGARLADRFRERLGLSLAYDRMQTGGFPSQFVSSAGTAASGGTPVTGAQPTLTTTGTQTFLLGRSGDNWWNQHSFRARGDYAISQHTVGYLQFQRQWSAYGYDQYESFLRTASGMPFDSGTASILWNGSPRRFSVTPTSFLSGDGQTTYWLLSGRLHHEFSNGAQLQIGGGRTQSPLNYYSTPGTGSTAAGGPGTISDRPYQSWFGNAQYSDRLTPRHHLTIGTDLRQDESQLTESTVPNWARREESAVVSGRSQGQAFNQGTYIQDQWRAAERLTVTGGARYDYWRTYDGGYGVGPGATDVNSRSNHSGSAKAAALWRGPAGLAFRGSVGNSFRSPSVYDLYRTWRSSTGITYAANPALEPERLLAVEAGVSRRWANRLELDAAFFQNRTSNLIYRTTDYSIDPSGNYRPVINAGRSRTNGLEASARVPLRRWLYATSSYTWNDAKITENPAVPDTVGKLVPFVPPHVASGTIFAFIRKASASVTGRYVTSMFSSDLNTDKTKGVYGAYDPFFSLDAGLSVPVGQHLSVECSAENLLNRIYYSYYPSPGRLVSVRLRIRL
ncbi:MAG: TonB-dependent receptor [Bryobacterales bacterium]|nr:TonB-dependent receptor [Bryobacterales bacterium]